MADVVIVGGGVVGCGTALLAANDGHDVTLLERDAAPTPSRTDDAWDSWERRGVNQFRLLHYFLARFRQIVTEELPDVVRELDAAGALRINPFASMPDHVSGGWRDGDERFESITGRRPVVEAAFARVVDAHPKITVRRGTGVQGLLVDGRARNGGTPHVDGVVTEAGETISGDLVVDAGGRRSALPSWLEAIGARPPVEEKEDCGFIYYGRHFRSPDGSVPFMFGPPLQLYDSFSTITLPADNGTWGVGVATSARDTAARALAHDDAWERVVRACPLIAHWIDAPAIQSVTVMAKIEDRIRHYTVDGAPLVTGVVSVGDAWACTNPSVGRGATIGLLHGLALRDLLREREGGGLDAPIGTSRRWDELTQATVAPLYRDTLRFDRHRLAQIDAQIDGRTYVTDDEAWHRSVAINVGSGREPALLRAVVDMAGLLAPGDEVRARPEVVAASDAYLDVSPEPLPGPTRAELLALLHA
jgi:2-polyprenyl-6-methoxyphenol hydroxylase-like FAD-dependent oxidoreductase